MSAGRSIDFRYAPPDRWTCIGRPDDPYKTLVDQDGRLLYRYARAGARFGVFRFERVVSFALQTDAKPESVTQRTEDAATPIVVTEIRYPHATLTLRAAGHAHDGLRTDIVQWHVAAHAEPVTTALWLQVQDGAARCAPAGLASSPFIYAHPGDDVPRWTGLQDLFTTHVDPSPDTVARELVLISPTHPLQVASAYDHGPASGLSTDLFVIAPGAPVAGVICLPQGHRDVAAMDAPWADAALAQERRFWQGLPLVETIAIPNADIMAMLTACARNILQAREVKDGLPEFQVGPTVYRGLWIIDGYFFLEAARFLSWDDDAVRGIDALLRRVRPNGAIEERSLDTKDTGLALATLVRQCELSGDRARLTALWPVMRRAVEYIRSLRAAALDVDLAAPEYGLLPAAFGNGGLGGVRAEYTTALWLLVGLKAVARAAGYLALDAEQQAVQTEFDGLMQALREHAARDMRTLPDGTPYLPMLKPGSGEHHWNHEFPGTPPPWQRVNPGTATWALAHAVYPGELFAADDPLVQNFCALLDQLDDDEGVPTATGWLPYQALWTYAASFYAHVWLYAGRPDKAVDYLYALANHAAPTRVWREEQSLAAAHLGQKVGDMPHNWAAAEFIRLVRNLIVWEEDGHIHLLRGLPESWLARGATLRLHTPTCAGAIDLDLTVDDAGAAHLQVRHTPGGLAPLAALHVHAPAWSAITLRTVEFDGQLHAVPPSGRVDILT